MRLNLGCGRKLRNGCINIDHGDFGQEVKLDLERSPLPYEDNSVEYVRADHFIEHLFDAVPLLNEVWRVLKPDGEFEIYVPYGLWDRQFSPVHRQIITEHWLQWLERNDNFEYYNVRRWKIKSLKTEINASGNKYEIHCIMQPDDKDI